MVIHSVFFDTLGHAAAERNLEQFLPQQFPGTTYKTSTLSEIKARLGFRAKLASLLAYPLFSRARYDIGFNRLRSELAYSLMVYWFLSKEDRKGPEVFHFRTQSICLLIPALIKNLRVVITIDMTTKQLITLRPYNKYFYQPLVWLEKRIFNSGVTVACYSRTTADSLIKNYEVAPGKVTFIHPSVRNEFFEVRKISENQFPTILFVGNDFKRKGGDILIKVFTENFGKEARLFIVSADPSAVDPSNSPNVVFYRHIKPNTKELFEIFARSDIFVLPTREEAYGIAFSEALAAGLPCIGTRTMAVPELIKENVTGLLTEIEDENDLKNKLSLLIRNAELRKKMAVAAREDALQRFALRKCLDRYNILFSGKIPPYQYD